jgi:hypothetical protein
MMMQIHFMLQRDRLIGVDLGTALQLVLGQRHGKFTRLRRRLTQDGRGQKHPPPEKPGCVNDQVSDSPGCIVQKDVVNAAKPAVGGADRTAP